MTSACHSGYYVYQYVTSMVAATPLARRILEEAKAERGTARRDGQLRLLESGCSRYPIELLKGVGVDTATQASFDVAMAEMNASLDEIEGVFAAQKEESACEEATRRRGPP